MTKTSLIISTVLALAGCTDSYNLAMVQESFNASVQSEYLQRIQEHDSDVARYRECPYYGLGYGGFSSSCVEQPAS